MNRSIFQIWKNLNVSTFLYCIFFVIFLHFFINLNFCSCFGTKSITEPLLKNFVYKNMLIKISLDINDNVANIAMDNFFNNYYKNKIFDLNIAKYYKISNGLVVPFDKYSCYSHPNLFFSCYNGIRFNIQLSHQNYNNNFEIFSKLDICGLEKSQLICRQLYLYSDDLKIQYLNSNKIELNSFEVYKNNYEEEIMHTLNYNKKEFNKIIHKVLSIKN